MGASEVSSPSTCTFSKSSLAASQNIVKMLLKVNIRDLLENHTLGEPSPSKALTHQATRHLAPPPKGPSPLLPHLASP